jgi:mannose-6-phosphate isomerase-like protein (cupin superfamily)
MPHLMKTAFAPATPFITKDGSQIRELMHPAQHAALGSRVQSFAEVIVAPGTQTELHRHRLSEEIYHVTQGAGRMTLGERQFDVAMGDTICIASGTAHCIACVGEVALKILCA